MQSSSNSVAACTRRDAQQGSAVIGPAGGTITLGNNQLIVPAGALDTATLITASVPADTIASIHFEPEGLQFRKPAGLVLDGEGCTVSGDGVDVLYLDDDGAVLERIEATYSNFWHTVAAPISHFSVYAIGI